MLKDNRILRSYSESFRLKLLSELEQGKYTKNELCRVYDVNPGTLYGWIRKHKKYNLLNKRVRIEKMDEKDKVKELQKRIDELKDLIVKRDLQLFEKEIYLEVLAEELGYKDVNELKKNLEAGRCSKASKEGKK